MEEKRAKENQRARFLNAAYLIKYLFFSVGYFDSVSQSVFK